MTVTISDLARDDDLFGVIDPFARGRSPGSWGLLLESLHPRPQRSGAPQAAERLRLAAQAAGFGRRTGHVGSH